MTYSVPMDTPLTPLAEVVAMALMEAGLSENSVSKLADIPRSSLKRKLLHGNFTYGELWKIADLLKTTPAKLVSAAEKRAA